VSVVPKEEAYPRSGLGVLTRSPGSFLYLCLRAKVVSSSLAGSTLRARAVPRFTLPCVGTEPLLALRLVGKGQPHITRSRGLEARP
jgi:hypothetical protein